MRALLFDFMNRLFKIPESVLVVLHTADLDVLLMNRADREGFWQSVTGSKNSVDELLTQTARREVMEETGIVIGDGMRLTDWNISNRYTIYPQWLHRYAPGVTHNTEHVFGLLVPKDVKITLNPREHSQYVWLPYLEAADRCFSPSNAEAILQLPRHK